MVNGKQIKVQFHIDDLKVLHNLQAVIDGFLNELRSEFGQEDELTEDRRLVHENLNIIIDYLIASKAIFTMFDYLEDAIVECAEDLENSLSFYPGNDQLFKIDADSPRFLLEDVDIFHSHFTRLFFCK